MLWQRPHQPAIRLCGMCVCPGTDRHRTLYCLKFHPVLEPSARGSPLALLSVCLSICPSVWTLSYTWPSQFCPWAAQLCHSVALQLGLVVSDLTTSRHRLYPPPPPPLARASSNSDERALFSPLQPSYNLCIAMGAIAVMFDVSLDSY